ncbi:hypothetical protein [Candidatus Tisiphia endosymbiont of Nemotelus uliginosus]|uniref:hypothetical protein n=1 Tax=Candidatus Tisiphia endosymbiont of Nemotelus uliginosus TaxID=3077926 RepID=UPI0035C91030
MQEKTLYLQEQATQQVNNLKKADTINKLQAQIQEVIAGLRVTTLSLTRTNISKLQEKACLYGVSRINEQKVSNLTDRQIKALVARSLFEIKYEKEINDILQGIWYTDNDNRPMPVAHKIKCLVDASRITKMAGYVIEKMMIDNSEQDLQLQKLAGQIIIDAIQKYQTRKETIKLTLTTDIVQKLAGHSKKIQHSIAEQLVDHIWQSGSEQIADEQLALMNKSAIVEQQLIPLIRQQFREELLESSPNLPTNEQYLSKNIEASIDFAVSKIRNSIYSIASSTSDPTSPILSDGHQDIQELNPVSHKEYNKIIKQTMNYFNQAQEELRVEQNIQQDKLQQQLQKNHSMFLKL